MIRKILIIWKYKISNQRIKIVLIVAYELIDLKEKLYHR